MAEDDNPEPERQRWLRLINRATATELAQTWDALDAAPSYTCLRPPEVGLVMLRGRAGGGGRRFNLGEICITRASVRLEDGRTGHSHRTGRDRTATERGRCWMHCSRPVGKASAYSANCSSGSRNA